MKKIINFSECMPISPLLLAVEVLEIICPESFAGFRFDLGPLLQGQMWFFIPIVAYVSLVIDHRGFGCEDNL